MTTDIRMCMARYERSNVRGRNYADLYCQYQEGHSDSHSWQSIRLIDARITMEQHQPTDVPGNVLPEDADYVSPAAQAATIVSKITAGDYDPYIEQILSAGHDRKRALRNVPGFGRKDRDRG